MITATKSRSRISKEQALLDYLYDEGPTTTEQLIARTDFHPDWLRKTLSNLRAEGKIENECLRDMQQYWLLP